MADMYDWINAQNINPLAGQCLHECKYCYVDRMKIRLPEMRNKYSGVIRLDMKVLSKSIKNLMLFITLSVFNRAKKIFVDSFKTIFNICILC